MVALGECSAKHDGGETGGPSKSDETRSWARDDDHTCYTLLNIAQVSFGMLGDQTTSHDLIEFGGGGISQVGTGSYKLSLRRKKSFAESL